MKIHRNPRSTTQAPSSIAPRLIGLAVAATSLLLSPACDVDDEYAELRADESSDVTSPAALRGALVEGVEEALVDLHECESDAGSPCIAGHERLGRAIDDLRSSSQLSEQEVHEVMTRAAIDNALPGLAAPEGAAGPTRDQLDPLDDLTAANDPTGFFCPFGCDAVNCGSEIQCYDTGFMSCECVSPYSCQERCGGMAPSGCFCDSACESLGDCCSDKVFWCG